MEATYQALRKRVITLSVSGRFSTFLCQQSSTTFHFADESPILEASAGFGGRLPFPTAT